MDAAFERGNYHYVAANGSPRDWRTPAALGMCGRTDPALRQLSAFGNSEARFYEGVIHWINGDEAAAIRRLEPLDSEYADNLLRLIRKPSISILSQLGWYRSADSIHNALEAGEKDPKFNMRNISFAAEDLPNRPDADIHDYYDSANPPDLYLAEMIEWHVIPPNLQELPCPIIGQTGDYDLHIQTILPWLRLFDEIFVSDTTEYADLQGLVDVPVTTFCKPMSLPPSIPAPIICEKDLDVIVTGTLLHSYYPDKAEMMRQILHAEAIEPFFYNGFFQPRAYYPILARSKVAVALTRHLGAIPTRGFEALAMGIVLMAPHESCLRLFVDNDDGIFPYSLEDDGLQRAMQTVLADYDRYAEGALRGMASIRAEFETFRSSSQYLRIIAFRAARPRPPRQMVRERPLQMRSVAFKGHLQAGRESTYREMRNASLETWKATEDADHTLASFTLPAREFLLEYVLGTLLPPEASLEPLVKMAHRLFGTAIERFPQSLALRFNFIRSALHFGDPAEVENAVALAKATLDTSADNLQLDPMDDIMPWDFCQNFFNYRTYLQIATEAERDKADRNEELKALILASLHYYYGRMSGEMGHFTTAASLDPAFPVYRLWQARELDRQGDASSAEAAIPILAQVVEEITYGPEAWSLMQAIKKDHDLTIPREATLRKLIEKFESVSLIDEPYLAIRTGPYFQAQRLSLALNEGYEIRKHEPRAGPLRLSILLADTNGARYADLVESLSRQSFDRASFEIICCDVFDRNTPHMMHHADTHIVIGQNENLYNRNSAFNIALARAQGDIVAFFDADVALSETALAEILSAAEKFDHGNWVFVNSASDNHAREAVHMAVLRKSKAISAAGLDESAYRAGRFSGPYELVERLQRLGFELRYLECVPAASQKAGASGKWNLPDFIAENWPMVAASERTAPVRENSEIARLRLTASS
jgi:hypothetical protein